MTTNPPPTRAKLLSDLWCAILAMRRNSDIIIFSHFKTRITWIGIVDTRATETELIDLRKDENVQDHIP